jgi:hypothetical protein
VIGERPLRVIDLLSQTIRQHLSVAGFQTYGGQSAREKCQGEVEVAVAMLV